ncbi:hypothetical protein Tco_0174910 [Tanacetum coccineum]
MLFYLIKNLCAPFGVSFDPKRYYKDGDCAIMLWRPRPIRHIALPPRDQRHMFLKYEGMEYLDTDIVDFEGRLARIHRREVHRVPVFDFGGLPDLMAEGLSGRMLMEHRDEAGAILDLDTLGTLQFQLGGARRRMSWRQFILALGLYTDEEMQTRSQAPEKVTVTDLFYLRGMDVGSIGRALGGLTTDILGGLTVIAPELPVIDMAELVRLQICVKLDDTWAWVAMGPERQPDTAAGAPAKAEDALIVDEGDQAVPAPVLEEDVHGLRRDVGSLRGLVERSMIDQGRFSTWMMSCMTQLMDASRMTYQAFDGNFRGSSPTAFQRRTRQRTGKASTSAAQQDPQQPDP